MARPQYAPSVSATMVAMTMAFFFLLFAELGFSKIPGDDDPNFGHCSPLSNITDEKYVGEALFAINEYEILHGIPKDHKLTLVSVDWGCQYTDVEFADFTRLKITAFSKALGKAKYQAFIDAKPFGRPIGGGDDPIPGDDNPNIGHCSPISNITDEKYVGEALFAINEYEILHGVPKDHKLTLVSVDWGCRYESVQPAEFTRLKITASSKALGNAKYQAFIDAKPFGRGMFGRYIFNGFEKI